MASPHTIPAAIAAFQSAVYGEDVRQALIDVATVVQTALENQLISVDRTLAVSGAGADAEVVGNNFSQTVMWRGNITNSDDINNDAFAKPGIWAKASAATPANWPISPVSGHIGGLLVIGKNADIVAGNMQIVFANGHGVRYRIRLIGSSWSDWTSLDVDPTPTNGSDNLVTSNGVYKALTTGAVTKVGTASVGSTTQPVYLNAGTITAMSGALSTAYGGTGNASVDTTPTSGSTKMVTSNGIYQQTKNIGKIAITDINDMDVYFAEFTIRDGHLVMTAM